MEGESPTLSKSTKLSDNLVKFCKIYGENVYDCSPRILRNKLSKPNTVYSTLKKQEESEKIKNCTVPKMKANILNLLDQLKNKSIWMELFKNVVAGK